MFRFSTSWFFLIANHHVLHTNLNYMIPLIKVWSNEEMYCVQENFISLRFLCFEQKGFISKFMHSFTLSYKSFAREIFVIWGEVTPQSENHRATRSPHDNKDILLQKAMHKSEKICISFSQFLQSWTHNILQLTKKRKVEYYMWQSAKGLNNPKKTSRRRREDMRVQGQDR